MARKRKPLPSAARCAVSAAYRACLAAGLLRHGRLRASPRLPDRRAEERRRACRGRPAGEA